MEIFLRKSPIVCVLIAILMFGINSCQDTSSSDDSGAPDYAYCRLNGVDRDVDYDSVPDGNLTICIRMDLNQGITYDMFDTSCQNEQGVASTTPCPTDDLVIPSGETVGMYCSNRYHNPTVLGKKKSDLYGYNTGTTPYNAWTLATLYERQCTGTDSTGLPFSGTFLTP